MTEQSPPAKPLLRRDVLRKISSPQPLRPRNRNDIVTGIDMVDFTGYAGRQIGQKVKRRPADILECHRFAQWRMGALEREHGARVGDAGPSERAYRAGRQGVDANALRAEIGRKVTNTRLQ